MSEHTPTPWIYRPCKHDDWGWIRRTREDGQPGDLVASARSGQYESEEALDQHRRDKTDPYGANAAFIVKACNAYADLVKALEKIADMDPHGIRADDLGRAARVAHEAILASCSVTSKEAK